jgi:hypothetical protein
MVYNKTGADRAYGEEIALYKKVFTWISEAPRSKGGPVIAEKADGLSQKGRWWSMSDKTSADQVIEFDAYRWIISGVCILLFIIHIGLQLRAGDLTKLDPIAIGIAVIGLSPWIARILSSAKFAGIELRFLEKKVNEQGNDLETIKFLVAHFLSASEPNGSIGSWPRKTSLFALITLPMNSRQRSDTCVVWALLLTIQIWVCARCTRGQQESAMCMRTST